MSTFKRIAIYGRQRMSSIADTLHTVVSCLQAAHIHIQIEQQTFNLMNTNLLHQCEIINYEQLGQNSDLVLVVGGDGSLLHAAHAAVKFDTPVLGINRGYLGFLTDISPYHLEPDLQAILQGEWIEEKRSLLQAEFRHENKIYHQADALNDVVLLPGKFAHMINFSIAVNQEHVCEQRADGLIVSTPTGSTAYALSGGGPILHPALEAIVLVPMFPHTLSSRPLVLHNQSEVSLHIHANNETSPFISCDGQERIAVAPDDKVIIRKKDKSLRLIHPRGYNYFQTLRTKLGWQRTE